MRSVETTMAGHGDRGGGGAGIGPKKTGRARPVHSAALIHRRQSPQLSLPPAQPRWLVEFAGPTQDHGEDLTALRAATTTQALENAAAARDDGVGKASGGTLWDLRVVGGVV